MTQHIDINCDIGEGFGNWRIADDDELMKLVSTVSVACGFHAGDPVTMEKTITTARANGVIAGAHPGLPDPLGFGRRRISVTVDDLYAYTVYQIGALQAFLNANSMALNHVKPHGALYLMVGEDESLASAFADALEHAAPGVALYWPAPVERSALGREILQRGGRVVADIYPDLDYAPDGGLLLQRKKERVDVAKAAEQVARFLEEGKVKAVDGSDVELRAQSICIHSDGPNSVEVARAVNDQVVSMGFTRTAVGVA